MGSDKSGGLESLGTPSQASVLAPSIFFFLISFSYRSQLHLYFIFTETQAYRDGGKKEQTALVELTKER